MTKLTRTSVQSLDVLQMPDALLKIKTVVQATGLSASTVYRMVTKGLMPQPIRMGARCTRFRSADVLAFIKAQTGNAAPL